MNSTPEYLKYEQELKKIDFLSIILTVIAIAAAIMIFFLPFFEIKESDTSYYQFSLYNDFRYCLDAIFEGHPEIMVSGLFIIISTTIGIIGVMCCIAELYNILTGNKKDYTIKLARIKNNGENKEKMLSYTQKIILTFIIMIPGVVIYSKLFAKMNNPSITYTYMSFITGVTGFIIIPIVLYVAYWTVYHFISKENKNLAYKILSDEEEMKNQAAQTQKAD